MAPGDSGGEPQAELCQDRIEPGLQLDWPDRRAGCSIDARASPTPPNALPSERSAQPEDKKFFIKSPNGTRVIISIASSSRRASRAQQIGFARWRAVRGSAASGAAATRRNKLLCAPPSSPVGSLALAAPQPGGHCLFADTGARVLLRRGPQAAESESESDSGTTRRSGPTHGKQ